MGILPEYDNDKIYQTVSDFFLLDVPGRQPSYAKIERRVSVVEGLSGQNADVTGIKGSSKGNSTEDRLLAGNDYWRAKQAIKTAIKSCSATSAIIMQCRYLQGQKVWQVQAKANISGNATYQKADQLARYEFADVIEYAKGKYGVADSIIPNFLKLAEISRNEVKTS